MDKTSKEIVSEAASHEGPKDPVEMEPLALLGTVLDNRYRIDALLGEGGMGEVYSAEHVQIGRKVAVKVLHHLYSKEEEVLERFRREARAATAIGHPNIVDVTDSGTTPDGRAFFVMEVLEGFELADLIIDSGWMDPQRAAHVTIQVCQAVGAAHEAGIIHRDLKPENVFLVTKDGEPDFVKILDFGIAKSTRLEMTRGGGLTQPGLAMGTPEYMAPEQAAGKPADSRVDVYATGGLLYAMLVGRPPHEGSNIMEVLTQKATKIPDSPRSIRPDIPEELDDIVMKALKRNPDKRHKNMAQLEYELRRFAHGRGQAVAALMGLRPSDIPVASGEYTRASSSDIPVAGTEGRVSREAASETGLIRSPNTEQSTEKGFGEDEEAPLSQSTDMGEVDRIEAGFGGKAAFGGEELDDVEKFFQPTHTVVRKPKKGLGWGWALVFFFAVAAGVTALFFVQKRREGKETKRREKEEALAMTNPDAGAGDLDAEVPDASLPDAAPLEPDAATPPRPRLTPAEVRFLVEMSWKSAKKGKWTQPEKESLLGFISRLERAKKAAEEIKKLRGFARKMLFRKGQRLRRRKRYKQAERVFRDLLALVPGDKETKIELVKTLVFRSYVALKKKKNTKAEALAGEAMSLDSGLSSAHYAWARTLQESGKLERALAEFEKIAADRTASKRHRSRAKRVIRELKKEIHKKKPKEKKE